MPYVEIIFETGNKSVAYYDTDEEMQDALAEHHRRAINGEPGTADNSSLRNDLAPGESRVGTWIAERVKKVLIYDEHPADYQSDQLIDVKEVKKVIDNTIKESEMNGVVHVQTVAAAIRDMSDPIVKDAGAQESQFKAPETAEADLSFLKAVESGDK